MDFTRDENRPPSRRKAVAKGHEWQTASCKRFKLLEDFIMTRTIEYYKTRIHLLEQRDPNINSKIIKKLKRRVKNMENTGQE